MEETDVRISRLWPNDLLLSGLTSYSRMGVVTVRNRPHTAGTILQTSGFSDTQCLPAVHSRAHTVLSDRCGGGLRLIN